MRILSFYFTTDGMKHSYSKTQYKVSTKYIIVGKCVLHLYSNFMGT